MFRLFLFVLLMVVLVDGYPISNNQLKVFVSIPPQKYLVKRIGGDYVDVGVMIEPGFSPETYDPSPKKIAALNQSQLYFQIGVPFEFVWLSTISSTDKKIKIIACCEGIRSINSSDNINGNSLSIIDPHIWTNPVNAKIIAKKIKETLIDEVPEFKQYFELNYHALIADLDALDKDIHSALQNRRTQYIIVAHPSWGYFAERYGLKQISLETNGKEKGPKGIAMLIDFARKEGIDTLFVQKQIKSASALIFAKELNANIIGLDPIAENYITNLREVARLIATATE